MSEDVKVVNPTPVKEAGIKLDYAPWRHAMYKICKDCGKMFAISDNDVIRFVQKFGTVPVRCSECREDRNTYFKSKTDETSN